MSVHNNDPHAVRLAEIQLRHNGITVDPDAEEFSMQGAIMGLKSKTSLLYACIQCPLCLRWVSWTKLITDIDNWLNCGFIVRMCNSATMQTLSPFYRKHPLEMKEGDYGHERACRLYRPIRDGAYGDFGVDQVPITEFTAVARRSDPA